MFTGNHEKYKYPSYKSRIREKAADLCKEGITKIVGDIDLEEGDYDEEKYRKDIVDDILDVIRGLSDYIY